MQKLPDIQHHWRLQCAPLIASPTIPFTLILFLFFPEVQLIWASPCLSQRKQWHPTPVLLPGKSHGRRSLVGCSPWGREELDTTEQLHFHSSFSCIAEGSGNPLQCSCLENPRDGGPWWAAIYGVAQSRTRLKRLSSSSSILVFAAIFFFNLLRTLTEDFTLPEATEVRKSPTA